MFTVEQRDALRERVLEIAATTCASTPGLSSTSLAGGGGEPYSDLDFTFGMPTMSRSRRPRRLEGHVGR